MAIESLRDVTRASASAFAGGAAYFGPTAPDPAIYTNWFLLTGEWFKWDGTAWFQPIAVAAPGAGGASPILSWVI